MLADEMKLVYTASKLCAGAIVLADELKLVYTASKIKLWVGASIVVYRTGQEAWSYVISKCKLVRGRNGFWSDRNSVAAMGKGCGTSSYVCIAV